YPEDDDAQRRALIKSAICQADCICSAISSTSRCFPPKWVRPGTHVIPVDSYKPKMAEVDTACAHVVLVDPRSAFAVRAGFTTPSRKRAGW
ncbi:hypothetical protein BJY52DRAFT_1086283, partial [Lactarius psammicola]